MSPLKLSPLKHIPVLAAAALAGLAALPASVASAGHLNFGAETVVRRLADVRLQNATGEPLYLGYKLTYQWFGLPYAVSTNGYALAVQGKPESYPIEKSRLLEWQGAGYVPTPLPEYRLTLADYALGYLAWLVSGALLMVYAARALIETKRRKRTAARQAASPAITLPKDEPAAEVTEQADSPPLPQPVPQPLPVIPAHAKPVTAAPAQRETTIVRLGPAIKPKPAAGAAPPGLPPVPAPRRPERTAFVPASKANGMQAASSSNPQASPPPEPALDKAAPPPKARYRVKAVTASHSRG